MGDAEFVEETGAVMTVGERLREAREASGLSLEDIATQTRIPTRHLESLEAGDFSRLPAPTYSVGFAKNYAGAVGLDRAEIGDQLRAEMGGTRPVYTNVDVFEPADPARAMPKWLILGGIVAIVLAVLIFNWLNNRSLEGPDEVVANETVAAPAQQAPPPAQPVAQGPVVVTATDAAWVEIKDGTVILKQGILAANEAFQVPADAAAPTLATAKPEALRITVGSTVVGPIGAPAKKVTVSLKPDELLRPQPAPSAAPLPAATRPPPQPAAARPKPPASTAAPAQQPAAPQDNSAVTTTNSQ
jgi:cytoskeletal protein RodZ